MVRLNAFQLIRFYLPIIQAKVTAETDLEAGRMQRAGIRERLPVRLISRHKRSG